MNQDLDFEPTDKPIELTQLRKAQEWWKTLSLGVKRTLVKKHSIKTIPDMVSCWIALGKPEDGRNFKDLKKGDQQ